MKLSRLYNRIVRYGIDKDPRSPKSAIRGYADTAILYGKAQTPVRKALVGIDIEVPEILLAEKLREKDKIDLLISHHPEGTAFAALYEVMAVQVDLLIRAGIDAGVAASLLEERRREVRRRLSPANHMRAVDAARLLDFPFMCVHTPADNHVASFLEELFKKQRPGKVKDIIALLEEIPEYSLAKKRHAGPCVILGDPGRAVGKVFLEMTGGTEGPVDVYGKLYKAGVRTLVSMHLSEEHFKKVKDAHLNVVIAGHIASDTLGLNLLLDRIEREEKFETLCCAGFTRFKRI